MCNSRTHNCGMHIGAILLYALEGKGDSPSALCGGSLGGGQED